MCQIVPLVLPLYTTEKTVALYFLLTFVSSNCDKFMLCKYAFDLKFYF